MVKGFPNFPRVGDIGKVRETLHHPAPSPIFRGSCAYAGCDLEARSERVMCPMHFTHEPSVKTPDPPPSCPRHGHDLAPDRCSTCEELTTKETQR